MKKSILIAALTLISMIGLSQNQVYVSGYYNSNGTYVKPYYRTAPDSSPYNNYSYPGNYNPNTNSTTTGSQTTYLNNYYNTTPTTYTTPVYTTPVYYTAPVTYTPTTTYTTTWPYSN